MAEQATVVELDGQRVEVKVFQPEPGYRGLARARRSRRAAVAAGEAEAVTSPMQGTVLEVRVAEGDEVEAGAVICVVEAMKMENEIVAHHAGVVTEPLGHGRRARRKRTDDLLTPPTPGSSPPSAIR